MMRALLTFVAFAAFSAHAGDVRIHQTDKYGNIQYGKPSYLIDSKGRLLQVDHFGNKQYHEQQYLITNDKTVPVDTFGNRQYNKPALVIEGRKPTNVRRNL